MSEAQLIFQPTFRSLTVMEGVTCVVLVVFLVLTTVIAAPQSLDPDKIYTPDDIEELNRAIAHEKCLRTPGCKPNILQQDDNARCKLGAGVDTMLKDMRVTVHCNPLASEVVWPSTGQCVRLLTQGPCPRGQWVKLTTSEFKPVCEPVPCGVGQAATKNGACLSTRTAQVCPPTQQLITNEFGQGECDCAPGLVYYAPTKACYAPYTKGPCPNGQVLKVMDEGVSGRVQCVANPCPKSSMAMVDSKCNLRSQTGPDTTCHMLNTPGPCTSGLFAVDNIISEPICVETHSIFNLPNLVGCPRGSIRDMRGRCRRNLAVPFRGTPAFVTSNPVSRPGGSVCPPGQAFLGGICFMRASSRP